MVDENISGGPNKSFFFIDGKCFFLTWVPRPLGILEIVPLIFFYPEDHDNTNDFVLLSTTKVLRHTHTDYDVCVMLAFDCSVWSMEIGKRRGQGQP